MGKDYGYGDFEYRIGIDVTDAVGVPGQNSPNPLSKFNNHRVVVYEDPNGDGDAVVFDPSYGTKCVALTLADAELEWENASVAGFFIQVGSALFAKKRDTTKPPETVWGL